MKTYCLSSMLLALVSSALAATVEADPRTATITDTAGSISQVSALRAGTFPELPGAGVSRSPAYARFGLDAMSPGMLIVLTKDFEFAIPLRSVNSIEDAGGKARTVKYQSREGETSLSGELADLTITGESDFGAFKLPTAKLKRLQFQQAGVVTTLTNRASAFRFRRDGPASHQSFSATLVLTDGSSIPVTNLRRHSRYDASYSDNNWIPPKWISRTADEQFTDFRLFRGETAQTISFDKLKALEFVSADTVKVTASSGSMAEMQLSKEKAATLTGFTGTSSNGYFYLPVKFVKSISFAQETGRK